MLIPTKIQMDKKHYEFIKHARRELHYKSLSDYVRHAVKIKVEDDRKKLRALKRKTAMEMIGRAPHDNFFESMEGQDFENR